jgi:hypothetical protein
MNTATSRQHTLFIVTAFVTAAFSIFSAVLMTEPGQSLNLPREWVVTYYQYHWLCIGLNIGLLALLWYLHITLKIWSRLWMLLASAGVVICIVAANFLLAVFFPSAQHQATYVSQTEANAILEDESVIYAVEINNEVRGYPRSHMEIPHIAGDNIGGKDVALTFCALSNVPVVIEQDIGLGQPSDLGILIQTHNNLVIVERNTGELIQQITMEPEFTDAKIVTHPNTMMTWKNFKKAYPTASVFIYPFDRAVDKFLVNLFNAPMKQQFNRELGPIFPTLDMQDQRLNPKEQVWGFSNGTSQLVFTRTFAQENPDYRFELDGQPLVLVYDKVYDVVNLFSREVNGQPHDFQHIDFRGVTETGQLQQLPMHNGVFWMVWSHWYPDTQVFN